MPNYKYNTKAGIRWLAKFNYADPKTGTISTQYKRGFLTKREARQYEEDFLEALTREEEEPTTITFEDVFYEYLRSHKHEDIKESSLQTKFNIFERRIFPTFRDRAIEEITDDDIAFWQDGLKNTIDRDGKHLSDSYLRTIQSQFNSIINYAYAKGYLKNGNPLADIKNMGIKDKRTEVWTVEEYERFAYAAMNYPEYYYCFEVLYWCGLREGEMLALTLADVDFNQGILTVSKTLNRIHGHDIITSPKTESSIRQVSMPQFLCDELLEYKGLLYEPTPEQRLFPVSKTGLTRSFKLLAAEAGLKHITIHGLRHSHVSLLIAKKYDIFEISKRIGHESVKTTQDIYGHLFDNVQKQMAEGLNTLRGG